jgi:CRP-like cAMP-binding protein
MLGIDVGLPTIPDSACASTSPFVRLALAELQATNELELETVARRWRSRGYAIDAAMVDSIAAIRFGRVEHVAAARGRIRSAGWLGIADAMQDVERRMGDGVSSEPWPARSLVGGAPTSIVLTKGQELSRATATGVAIVESGRLLVIQPGGSRLAVDIAERGDVVGGQLALDPDAPVLDGEALCTTRVAICDPAIVAEYLKQDRTLREVLEHQRDLEVQRAATLTAEIASVPASARFARLVLDLDARFGRDRIDGSRVVDRSLTQDELGRLIGASRKSIVRALGELREAGAVTLDRRRLHIRDRNSLVRYAELVSEPTPDGP